MNIIDIYNTFCIEKGVIYQYRFQQYKHWKGQKKKEMRVNTEQKNSVCVNLSVCYPESIKGNGRCTRFKDKYGHKIYEGCILNNLYVVKFVKGKWRTSTGLILDEDLQCDLCEVTGDIYNLYYNETSTKTLTDLGYVEFCSDNNILIYEKPIMYNFQNGFNKIIIDLKFQKIMKLELWWSKENYEYSYLTLDEIYAVENLLAERFMINENKL